MIELMMQAFIPKTGDTIQVEYEGRRVTACVILASKNGKSLMLAFQAMLGGHVGMMPVTVDDHDNYVSLIEGKPVGIYPAN